MISLIKKRVLSQAVVFITGYAEMLIGPAYFFTVFFESLFIVIGVKPGILTRKFRVTSRGLTLNTTLF